jgi:DNA-binding LacI/PurR family transcriptional regulator
MLDQDDTVLGYCCPVIIPRGNHEMVLRTLGHFGKPVAIFTQIRDWEFPAVLRKKTCFRIFPAGTTAYPCGQVARYILRRGHRRAAYISPYHGLSWSRARLDDLVCAFRSAGYPDTVVPFTLDRDDRDYFDIGMKNTSARSLIRFYRVWKKKTDAIAAARITPLFLRLEEVAIRDAGIHLSLAPLLPRILADTSITAWIAVNDFVAGVALEFFHQQGIEPARMPLLVSFDNSYIAVKNRITSFDFNLPGIITAMLGFITGARSLRPGLRKREVEVQGHLVIRETV